MNRSVLVTDGEQRAALAVVRSLGGAGCTVHVCSERGRSLAGASRFCQTDSVAPNPLTDPTGFARAVGVLVRELKADVLVPISEPALLAVVETAEQFPGTLIVAPRLHAFEEICNKALVLDRAAECGIAVPRQVALADPHDPAASAVVFPVALKPSRSIGERRGQRVKTSVRYASDRVELDSVLAEFDAAAFPVLAQQRIVGPGIGVFLLRWEGRILAQFAHRRLREKPPSGGVSVYRESIALDPELFDRSCRLLESFDWSGVAMVEYKIQAETGVPYLMEINGRFWGSLQLAVDSGVDFPVLLLAAASGKPRPAVHRWKVGVRSRWWWGDVDQLLTRLRRSRADLNLPPEEPGRFRALLAFLRVWWPGDRNEVLKFGDAGPFARESIDWFRRR